MRFWFTLLFFALCIHHNCAQKEAGCSFSDLHNSVLYRVFTAKDLNSFADTTALVSLQHLEEVDSRFVLLSIGIPKYGNHGPGYTCIEEVYQFLKDFRRYCEINYPRLSFVNNKEKALAAQKANKIAVAYALEGAHLLEGKTNYLDSLQAVGMVMLGPVHWYATGFILSANPSAQSLGIASVDAKSRWSASGQQLLEKLIELEILIDVSHMPPLLFREVVEINRGRTKLIASHANAYAVYPHPRNLTDDQLRDIARTGGLVGVCLHDPILSEESATLGKVVEHIQHIAGIIGVEKVCLGTDYEGNTRPPRVLASLVQLPGLATELSRAGFSQEDIERIMGSNVFRLWD